VVGALNIGLSDWVLLLPPSRGREGGIERYAETLEWAFTSARTVAVSSYTRRALCGTCQTTVTGMAPTDESPESPNEGFCVTSDPARLREMRIQAAGWARECYSPERYAALAVSRLLL
jgi:hypothetical protein